MPSMAFCLELTGFPYVTILRQYLPFVRSARLQVIQFQKMTGAAALVICRLAFLIAAGHAINHMVCASGIRDPFNPCRVLCNFGNAWAFNNADFSFVR